MANINTSNIQYSFYVKDTLENQNIKSENGPSCQKIHRQLKGCLPLQKFLKPPDTCAARSARIRAPQTRNASVSSLMSPCCSSILIWKYLSSEIMLVLFFISRKYCWMFFPTQPPRNTHTPAHNRIDGLVSFVTGAFSSGTFCSHTHLGESWGEGLEGHSQPSNQEGQLSIQGWDSWLSLKVSIHLCWLSKKT